MANVISWKGFFLAVAVQTCFQLALLEAQEEPSAVSVARVVEAKAKTGQRAVGTVVPSRTSTIGSAVDGRVLEFLIELGHQVAKDQPLAQLRTDTLLIELTAAKAELALYQHQLSELENGSRKEDVAEAEANMKGAKAAMDNAASQLQRLQSLSVSRAVSDSDLENAKQRADATRHAHLATKALFERIMAGPRAEQIAQARAQVDLQGQRIRLIEDRIQKHTIVAPFDGFVSKTFTDIGAWLSRGDPIAEIVQMDEVEIETPITGKSATQLRKGDTVRVEFPDLPEKLLTGKVDRIVPVADPRARTFPAFIRIQNEIRDGSPTFMAGMLARLELPAGEKEALPAVPKDALVLNGRERSVYVVDMESNSEGILVNGTGVVRKVSVDLGIAFDKMIQVTGSIRAGELVVVVGNERLIPGRRVKVIDVIE